MTVLELLARQAAESQYENARRDHNRKAQSAQKLGQPLIRIKHEAAARRLDRYAATEIER